MKNILTSILKVLTKNQQISLFRVLFGWFVVVVVVVLLVVVGMVALDDVGSTTFFLVFFSSSSSIYYTKARSKFHITNHSEYGNNKTKSIFFIATKQRQGKAKKEKNKKQATNKQTTKQIKIY